MSEKLREKLEQEPSISQYAVGCVTDGEGRLLLHYYPRRHPMTTEKVGLFVAEVNPYIFGETKEAFETLVRLKFLKDSTAIRIDSQYLGYERSVFSEGDPATQIFDNRRMYFGINAGHIETARDSLQDFKWVEKEEVLKMPFGLFLREGDAVAAISYLKMLDGNDVDPFETNHISATYPAVKKYFDSKPWNRS